MIDAAAPAAVVYRRKFQVDDAVSVTANLQRRQNEMVFLCEESDSQNGLMLVELFLKPSPKSKQISQPRRTPWPCLSLELFSPSQSLEAVVFGSGRYSGEQLAGQIYSWVDQGHALDWSFATDSDPLFVMARYSAQPSELPKLRDLQRRTYDRVREREQRGSLLYQWSYDYAEDGSILVTALELYRDLEGFQFHLSTCEDLFEECDPLRTLLRVELYGSADLMQKCQVFQETWDCVRLFRSCSFSAEQYLPEAQSSRLPCARL